jgi:hypothetical protein
MAQTNAKMAKTAAGHATSDSQRYFRVGVGRRSYKVHRIIWKMVTGDDPRNMLIDHKDLDGANNRWSNLRLATHQENQWNKKVYGKRSGLPKGVHYNKKRAKPYRAQIVLGSFETAEEAERAYLTAAARLHGPFFWSS